MAKKQRVDSVKAAVEVVNHYESLAMTNIEDIEEPQLTVQLTDAIKLPSRNHTKAARRSFKSLVEGTSIVWSLKPSRRLAPDLNA